VAIKKNYSEIELQNQDITEAVIEPLNGKLCYIQIILPKYFEGVTSYLRMNCYVADEVSTSLFKDISITDSCILKPSLPNKDIYGHDVPWSVEAVYLADEGLIFHLNGNPGDVVKIKVVYEE